ncbi:hypothetical protein ACJMK2_024932 [Sinanodonta woodiana]|uniref:Uncharacterized protein n=1 Tax=Sinanodonta woodiana TaxID=1069815 RepID=A0ABD3XGX6_SINWO
MGLGSTNNTNTAAADEREYEEPRINETEQSIYLEPIGIETVHREYNSISGSCINGYEKLRPDGNQGNNTYTYVGAEQIVQVVN